MERTSRSYDAAEMLGHLRCCWELLALDGKSKVAAIQRFAADYEVQIRIARQGNDGWRRDFIEDATEELVSLVGGDEVRQAQLSQVIDALKDALYEITVSSGVPKP